MHPPQWLEVGGYEAPPTQRVDCGLRYSSRLYQMPEGWGQNAVRCWVHSIAAGSRHGEHSARQLLMSVQ